MTGGAQLCSRAARASLAGACPMLPLPASLAAANATGAAADGDADAAAAAWDLLSHCGGGGGAAPCVAAVGDYIVAEGCCAATVAAARRRWRADVLSHPRLGRRFRVAWGGGRLQVALPSPPFLAAPLGGAAAACRWPSPPLPSGYFLRRDG